MKKYNIILNHVETGYDVNDDTAAVKNTVIATFFGRKPTDCFMNDLWNEIKSELIQEAPENLYLQDGAGFFLRVKDEEEFILEYYSLGVIENSPKEEEEEW